MAQTTFANPETLVNNIAEVRSTMKELKEVDKQLTDRLRVWATENHEFFKDGKLDFEKGTIHFNSKPKLQVPQSFKDQLIMLDLAEESPALVKVSLNETEIMHLLNTNLNPALAGYLTEEGFAVIPDGKENFRINTK